MISNGKDQILRLWDLRMMRSNTEFESVAHQLYGIPRFDYRCVFLFLIGFRTLRIAAEEKVTPAQKLSSIHWTVV